MQQFCEKCGAWTDHRTWAHDTVKDAEERLNDERQRQIDSNRFDVV